MKTPTINRSTILFFLGLGALGGCNKGPTPGSVTVHVVDVQSVFAPTGTIHLFATVIDTAGAKIANAAVVWTVEPPEAAAMAMVDPEAPKGRVAFTLKKEGQVKFKACADAGVCGSAIVLVVDKPALVVSAPAAAAELGSDGSSAIQVAGQVTSKRGARVFVDGVEAPVTADGSWHATVAPRFGVNHVEVVATDGVNDEARIEMDVLWAEKYAPALGANGAPGASFADGVVLALGQRFFDDGTAPDLTAHPLAMRDLAQPLVVGLDGLDVTSRLPDPLLSATDAKGDGVMLRATSAVAGQASVEIGLTDAGFDVFLRIGQVNVVTTGQLRFAGQTISLDGNVVAALSAYAPVFVGKPAPDQPVQVGVGSFQVALESLTPHFGDASANALFDVAGSAVRATFERQLQTTLGGVLDGRIPGVLKGLFTAVDGALANKTIPISAAPLPPVTLTLDGHIGTIVTTPLDRLLASLTVTVATDHATPVHPSSRGVALTEAMASGTSLFDSPRVQLGVRLALLNSVLHGLWNSGLLELAPSPPMVPAKVTGKLPPIARAPRPGEAWDLMISLGELELSPSGKTPQGTFGVSIEAGVNVTLADGTLALKVADVPDLRVWTIVPPPDGSLYTDSFLRTLLLELVWKQARQAIASGLAFKLPIPPLDGLVGLAPALTGLKLAIGAGHPLAVRDGFLVIDVDSTATLP